MFCIVIILNVQVCIVIAVFLHVLCCDNSSLYRFYILIVLFLHVLVCDNSICTGFVL
jgi:hypothetical protein